MSLVRVATVVVFGAAVVAPLDAQVPRRPREQQVANLPRLLVATPYVSAGADSAPAVQVGIGMRERMSKIVEGNFNVLTSEQMNEALKQYGYPANAILSPALATTLAKSVQARLLVSSQMNKSGNGYSVVARLVGSNDEAGSVVSVAQTAGQGLNDFGGNDTANVIAALREMLRIAPTNQKLREQAFRYFLNAEKPQIAKEVADSGIKIDPYNADFYDLKSNACAFLSDFRCSVDALEQSYSVDSTKADTLFVTKILAFSEQRLADTNPRATAADTARYVKWAQFGSKKYPNSVPALQALSKAYGMTGQVDSTIAVAQRLVAANPQDVTPLLAAAQTLIN